MIFPDRKLTGDMLLFYINGQPYACETACDISVNMDLKSVSPYLAGGWEHVIPGIRSWQMTVNSNFISNFKQADFKTVLGAIMNYSQLSIAIRTDNYTPAFFVGGYAYPTTANFASSGGDIVGTTAVFKGNGPLIYTSDASDGDYWRIINANPIEADKPTYFQTTL